MNKQGVVAEVKAGQAEGLAVREGTVVGQGVMTEQDVAAERAKDRKTLLARVLGGVARQLRAVAAGLVGGGPTEVQPVAADEAVPVDHADAGTVPVATHTAAAHEGASAARLGGCALADEEALAGRALGDKDALIEKAFGGDEGLEGEALASAVGFSAGEAAGPQNALHLPMQNAAVGAFGAGGDVLGMGEGVLGTAADTFSADRGALGASTAVFFDGDALGAPAAPLAAEAAAARWAQLALQHHLAERAGQMQQGVMPYANHAL